MKSLVWLLLVGCAAAQTVTSQSPSTDSRCVWTLNEGRWSFERCPSNLVPAPAPEPFDVPAVRKPRNEEYAKVCADNKLVQGQYPTIYKTLCSEDAIAPWTCADPRRTLLPDQQTPPKWHCYAMWELGGK